MEEARPLTFETTSKSHQVNNECRDRSPLFLIVGILEEQKDHRTAQALTKFAGSCTYCANCLTTQMVPMQDGGVRLAQLPQVVQSNQQSRGPSEGDLPTVFQIKFSKWVEGDSPCSFVLYCFSWFQKRLHGDPAIT